MLSSPPPSRRPGPSCSPSPFAAMMTPHPAESRPTSVSPPPRDRSSPPSMPSHDGPTTSPRPSPDVPHRYSVLVRRLPPPPRQTISLAAALTRRPPPKPPVASSTQSSPSPVSVADLAHATPRRRRLLSPSPRRASSPPPLVRSPRVPSTINNLVVPLSPSLPLHPSPSPAPRLCLNRPPRDYPLELHLP
jgi:hypothetical protein